MRQRINTLAFCFGDISVPLVSVVFKHIDKKKNIHFTKVNLTSDLLCSGFFDSPM